MNDKVINLVLLIVVVTLAVENTAVIVVLLAGLFHPQVSNDKIFAILGPAFQMTVGAFIGVMSSRLTNQRPPSP